MDYNDQPIESLASYELNIPNDGLKSMLRKLGLGFLILIALVSIGLNGYLYRTYLNLTATTTLSDSELREKNFFDRYRDEIDILIFSGGSMEEGLVLDETEDGVLFKLLEGTTQFGKADIRRIVHNVFQKKGLPVAEELLKDKNLLVAGVVIGFILAFSLCLNVCLLLSRSRPSPLKRLDTLILKNGKKEQGQILKETEEGLILKSSAGTYEYSKADIEKIIYNLNQQRNQEAPKTGEAA